VAIEGFPQPVREEAMTPLTRLAQLVIADPKAAVSMASRIVTQEKARKARKLSKSAPRRAKEEDMSDDGCKSCGNDEEGSVGRDDLCEACRLGTEITALRADVERLTREREDYREKRANEADTLRADLDRVCRELGAEKIEHNQARAEAEMLRRVITENDCGDAGTDRACRICLACVRADLAALRAENVRLREALEDLLDLFATDEEGATGHYDRIAMEFYEETRIWPPGKSAPMGMYLGDMDDKERHRTWTAWIESRRSTRVAAARRALATTKPGEGA
jgi:hypothetical protein